MNNRTNNSSMKNRLNQAFLALMLCVSMLLSACAGSTDHTVANAQTIEQSGAQQDAGQQGTAQQGTAQQGAGQQGSGLYDGRAFEYRNNNVPAFSDEELVIEPFELYSELDSLGRCGVAYANICEELMPTEGRESIGMVKPSGWQTAKYQGLVEGNYLYNRCHLIGFQLAGENANEKNLITGTRYMNVDGMLPFENMVADFVKDTGYHVLYRVTPVFEGDELVARGVIMEARSVEDKGQGLSFNVYVYNVQPGVIIDYASGSSRLDENYDPLMYEEQQKAESQGQGASSTRYVLNTNSNKFHLPGCSSVKKIRKENKKTTSLSREILIERGYSPCGSCKP